MKKLFLSLAAVAALTACSKSYIEYDEPKEISINPIAGNMTKSMMETQTFVDGESFNVWAWYKQVPAGTPVTSNDANVVTWNASNNESLYIKESTFIDKGDNWGGATPYYWPKVGSLLFAGYYPTTVKDNVDYTFNSTTNQMVFSNINQSVVDNEGYTEDLMYFNMTGTSYDNGPVPVVFKHALSWITVNLARSENNVTSTTTFPKIHVNSVVFTNVNNKGTGTVTGTNGIISWATNGTAENTTVTPEGGVTLLTAAAEQTEPLFIPQTFADNMEIQVNYTIYSSAEEFFTETYSAKLSSMTPTTTGASHTAWLPGKHYTYNIAIGVEEILISPTVTAWDGVEVEIPIQ